MWPKCGLPTVCPVYKTVFMGILSLLRFSIFFGSVFYFALFSISVHWRFSFLFLPLLTSYCSFVFSPCFAPSFLVLYGVAW